VVPAVVLVRVVSGRSTALGAGRVAHGGWRVLVFCFVVATPVLIWLGTRDSMHAYYARYVMRGGVMLWVCNGLVIVVEHAWIEGVLLALAVPPQVPFDDEEPVRTGRLAFLGFGLPPGARGFAAWVGIPALVWPALIAQALVFGLVHVGKTPEELLTAFPGGLGLGMLTWRMRSVWPSVLLHVGTGAIILVTILLSR
jgi:membrane protease YdiL (CAAX protease family)